MWIVKNEAPETLSLPELGVEIPCKEYLDLDAHGREKAEAAESVRRAAARGILRTITKVQEKMEKPAPEKPESASPPAVLRALAENPPLPAAAKPTPFLAFASQPLPEGEATPPLGIREAFRRASSWRRHKEGGAEPEPPPSAEAAALREELERFRRALLGDIQRLLDEYLRP